MTGPSDSSVQAEREKFEAWATSPEVQLSVKRHPEFPQVYEDYTSTWAWSAWNRRAALPAETLESLIEKITPDNIHSEFDRQSAALPVAPSDADRELMEQALERIEQTLTIPAAEYVPAIGDVFLIIDQTRAALRTRLLRHSEGKE